MYACIRFVGTLKDEYVEEICEKFVAEVWYEKDGFPDFHGYNVPMRKRRITLW